MTLPIATNAEWNQWVELFMKVCTSKTKTERLNWLAEINQLETQYDFKTELAR